MVGPPATPVPRIGRRNGRVEHPIIARFDRFGDVDVSAVATLQWTDVLPVGANQTRRVLFVFMHESDHVARREWTTHPG